MTVFVVLIGVILFAAAAALRAAIALIGFVDELVLGCFVGLGDDVVVSRVAIPAVAFGDDCLSSSLANVSAPFLEAKSLLLVVVVDVGVPTSATGAIALVGIINVFFLLTDSFKSSTLWFLLGSTTIFELTMTAFTCFTGADSIKLHVPEE